jgi:hypothetical protein
METLRCYESSSGECVPIGKGDVPQSVSELERDITITLNRHSAENNSNTPDFILAQYLLGCLAAWNTAVQQRETWYGRGAIPVDNL